MKELKKNEIVNVEDFFNEYVEYFGGEIISKKTQNIDAGLNADYYFKNDNIIAELQCFEKDTFNKEEDIPKGSDLDLYAGFTNSIDRVLHKANKQISESKKTFSNPDAKGLVLLCNDGDYSIGDAMFLFIISGLIRKKYLESDIDGYVYFTINDVPKIDYYFDKHLWMPYNNDDYDQKFRGFINKLGYKFLIEFYTMKTGIKVSDELTVDDFENGVTLGGERRIL